jgi:molybdopterin/thiamine biosynthesis adenylyltransferase
MDELTEHTDVSEKHESLREQGQDSSLRFEYGEAFSRNIGWLTEEEQANLRQKRVAIGGLGGVGGVHLLTLTRLGIGKFHIADLDRFDLVNFNRQAGANMRTLGLPKVDVMADMATAIDPELEIVKFADGISEDNIEQFLQDVDIYVDGLDFFAFDIREKLFAKCYEKGIPAVTAAPIGMGAALLNFLPGRMTFEQYFRFHGASQAEKALRFLLGVAPAMLHRRYLVDPSRVNFKEQYGPSTAIACELCAGVAATQVLKILLGRAGVLAAPKGLHFDAYSQRLRRTHRRRGNGGLYQRLVLAIARRQFRR